jgi:hypothetical protein
MAGVMKASGATSAYQVAKRFDAALEKRFEKYARGSVSPTSTTLNLVEKSFPNTRKIYAEGPGLRVALWRAMGGTLEQAWECVARYDKEFEVMRRCGASQDARARVLSEKLKIRPVAADYLAWSNGLEPNLVARQINESAAIQECINMDALAALIGLWRVSLFVGWCPPMAYLLDGVCKSVVLPALLASWNINTDEFVAFLMTKQEELENPYKDLLVR